MDSNNLHYRNLTLCWMLSADELKLSAETSFVKGETLDIERYSVKKTLSSVELSVKCDAPQSAVSSRL
jgi:hypothetical protein